MVVRSRRHDGFKRSAKEGEMMTAANPIQWEEVACPLCDGRSEDELLSVASETDRPFRVVSCRSCGMSYLNPRPNEASIGRFYPEDYEPYQPPKRRRSGWWPRLREKLLGPDRDSMTALPFYG